MHVQTHDFGSDTAARCHLWFLCGHEETHTHTNTHTHYPQRATRANISHLNTEKRLAISQRSWVPLITRAFKRESGERRWACNEPLGGEVDGHSRWDRPAGLCVAVPVPSEEWAWTFSPGITEFPGRIRPAPLALLWYSSCPTGCPDWKDGIPEPG